MVWERREVDGSIEWHEPNDGVGWHGQVWTSHGTVLSEEALRSLGLVAYWAAWLEFHLEEAVIELLFGLTGTGRGKVMTRDMTASGLIQKARSLVQQVSTPDEKALAALGKAGTALQARNRVLHGAMGGHLTEGMTSLSNRRRGYISEEVSDAEIAGVAEQVFDAAMEVVNVPWHRLIKDAWL